MPLGIIDAAHIFTGITSPLQLQGARSTIYIDDLLSVTDSFEKGLIEIFLELKTGWHKVL